MSRARKPHVESQGTKPPQSTAPLALMWPYQGQKIGENRERIHRGPHSIQAQKKESVTIATAEVWIRDSQTVGYMRRCPLCLFSIFVFSSFLFIIIICKIIIQGSYSLVSHHFPSWYKTLFTHSALLWPWVRNGPVKNGALERHKEWWEVRSHWCVSWDEECLKLSHVKWCAGVACGGYHLSIFWGCKGVCSLFQ